MQCLFRHKVENQTGTLRSSASKPIDIPRRDHTPGFPAFRALTEFTTEELLAPRALHLEQNSTEPAPISPSTFHESESSVNKPRHEDIAASLDLVKKHWININYLSHALQKDTRIMQAAASQEVVVLFINVLLKEYKPFILEVVKSHGRSFFDLSPKFQMDEDIIWAAVENDPTILNSLTSFSCYTEKIITTILAKDAELIRFMPLTHFFSNENLIARFLSAFERIKPHVLLGECQRQIDLYDNTDAECFDNMIENLKLAIDRNRSPDKRLARELSLDTDLREPCSIFC